MERSTRFLVLMAALALAAAATPARCRVYATRAEGLVRVFGADAHFEARTAYLTPAEVESVRALARAPLATARVTYWVATRGDSLIGRGFLDTFTVRTMPATLLVAVDPEGGALGIELLAFHEPEDYRPSDHWLARLAGCTLSSRLRPGDAIDGITGATISARTFAASLRRCLALARLVTVRQP